jgi:dTDP-4-dehydrorhamnose 3,5-epimerase-like enzyme
MYVLFGWLGSVDLNGSPKLFSRDAYLRMRLVSDDWFLDPEIMIKAHDMGLQVIELNVVGQLRRGGRSHVRSHTVFEFVKNIVRYRWGEALRAWRATLRSDSPTAAAARASTQPQPIDSNASAPGTLADVRELRQPRHVDGRGFLQKVLTASQCGGEPPGGEVYVTAATSGQSKGHHYHLKMGEWFSVIQGRAELYLVDPRTGDTQRRSLSVDAPSVVYVPAGIAHALYNAGPDDMLCVAWAEREHDPTDVMPYRISIDS